MTGNVESIGGNLAHRLPPPPDSRVKSGQHPVWTSGATLRTLRQRPARRSLRLDGTPFVLSNRRDLVRIEGVRFNPSAPPSSSGLDCLFAFLASGWGAIADPRRGLPLWLGLIQPRTMG